MRRLKNITWVFPLCTVTTLILNHHPVLPLNPSIPPNFVYIAFPTRLGPPPCLVQRSAADDASRPGLVFGARLEVGYGHLHRLDLLVFGRDGADFVAHLVTFHRHILALDAGGEGKKEKGGSKRKK